MLVSDVVAEVLIDSTCAEVVLFACEFLIEFLAFLVLLRENVDRGCISSVREEFGKDGLDLGEQNETQSGFARVGSSREKNQRRLTMLNPLQRKG